MTSNTKVVLLGASGLGVLGIIASYAIGSNPEFVGASALNLFLGRGAPKGELTVELRQAATKTATSAVSPAADAGEWSSYNRTVTSDRFSPLTDLNPQTAANLKVLCTYDTNRLEGNETGLIMAHGGLVGTTAEDIFSIDPNTCKENWRVHRKSGFWSVPVNRGAVFANGKVYRGFNDMYVRAYDARTGQQIWETFIGQRSMPGMGMTSAPIAWNGTIFIGTAGGDVRNVRGRVLALDAKTGKVNWQISTVPTVQGDEMHGPAGKMPQEAMLKTWSNQPDIPVSGGGTWTSYTIDPEAGYLYIPVGNAAPDYIKDLRPGSNQFANHVLVVDARTGNYLKSFQVMKDDWHDWDISNTPVVYTTRAGRKQFSMSPKDGHLYAYDRGTDQQLYRNPVTRVENADAPFEAGKPVHFCPGSVGGGEWNGTAFDAQYNLLFTGTVERCVTVSIQTDSKAARAANGSSWIGVATFNPLDSAGKFDDKSKWAGWLYATDADTGQWAWRARTNFPVLGGVTPTAGGVVMFGDIGGNFYVLNASDGAKLWSHHFDGALAGGIITYNAGAGQRIALSSGMSHPLWPVEPRTGKVVILGM
ncbi:MAG: PQQ-binding-like beta-propeller repeat protein [Sphingomonadales bacterium]|nr:PQQ-binding-like beta-propeller repeat protein [Sphingomonadales bacterium]